MKMLLECLLALTILASDCTCEKGLSENSYYQMKYVSVMTEGHRDEIEFILRDNGVRIAPEDKDFTPEVGTLLITNKKIEDTKYHLVTVILVRIGFVGKYTTRPTYTIVYVSTHISKSLNKAIKTGVNEWVNDLRSKTSRENI